MALYRINSSSKMIEEAKKLNNKITFSVQDIENLNYESNHFDYVIAIGVFEYLERDEIALREIERILKIDGKAILEFNNKLWHSKMNDIKEPNSEFPMIRRNHNPFEIGKIIEKEGLTFYDLHFYHMDEGYNENKFEKRWEAVYLASAFITEIKK